MPDVTKKLRTTRLPLTGAKAAAPINPLRAGMPALDSIHSTETFSPRRKGPKYQIIHTTEVDTYENSPAAQKLRKVLPGNKAPSLVALAAAVKAKAKAPGDNFAGKDRKAAKLSVGTGTVKSVASVAALVATLPSIDAMLNHKPTITTAPTSGRVVEEQRNVSLSAFLYASSRENDNDFHLIVGGDPNKTPEVYMTMEVSGLPPQSFPSFQALNAARDSFKKFFGAKLPGSTYDYYHPPIPIKIKGSLFFDRTHAKGQRPGPPSLKSRMPTVWEVHPLTSITLGP